MEWVLAEQATFSVGGVTVPFYDTLGPDTVAFILNQTETKTVVCARRSLEKLCQVKKEQILQNGGGSSTTKISPQFSAVILVDGVTQAASNMAQAVGLDVLSFAKVEAVGAHFIATNGSHKHSPPSSRDVATFCYTSGTTGNPKGALITHENLTSAMAGVIGSMPEIEVQPYDRHISYLPLPHIFERKVMAQVFLAGASVAFYRGDPTLLVQDFQACRPTLLAVAPRVLNSIYDKVYIIRSLNLFAFFLHRHFLMYVSRAILTLHFCFELSLYVYRSTMASTLPVVSRRRFLTPL
jgi:long-chain acyl-CoA synthetase